MSADFREVAIAMAKARPFMRASTLIDLALAIEGGTMPDLDNPRKLAVWAKAQPEVAQYLTADRRIYAIKELRALTNASLRQAKDAIDVAVTR